MSQQPRPNRGIRQEVGSFVRARRGVDPPKAIALIPTPTDSRCLDCISSCLTLRGIEAGLVAVDPVRDGRAARVNVSILSVSSASSPIPSPDCLTCSLEAVAVLLFDQSGQLLIKSIQLSRNITVPELPPAKTEGRVVKNESVALPAGRKIVAVIPAYDEERFIGSVVLTALKYTDKVVVVDDGSSDKTAEVAAAAGAHVIQHERNLGKGAALNSGFSVARKLGADALVLLDGDGQHRPDDIPAMLRPVLNGEADMVIGSRYLEFDSEIPGYRRAGQQTVTLLANAASGVASTDSWSGFRAFSARAIENICFNEDGWGVDPEFQFQARDLEMKVAEVPIVALYQEKAKRNPLPHGLKTVNAIIRMTGQYRPLLFMGGFGFIATVAGIMIGLRVVAIFQASKQLAIGTMVLSALLIILGVITASTGFVLHSIRALLLQFDARLRRHG